MFKKSLLKTYADHFFKLELNVTCISSERNQWNLLDSNLFKSPCHEWISLQSKRQSEDELNSYNWDNSIGIGAVLGFNNLIALDIDGCVEDNFLKVICDIIGINSNYEWIIKTGSGCGFQILLKCNDIQVNNEEIEKELVLKHWLNVDDFGYQDVNAYYPIWGGKKSESGKNILYDNEILNKHFNNEFKLSDLFQKIEFRWKGHSVLPISLHQSGLTYCFVNSIPKSYPSEISFNSLQKLKELICAKKADFSGNEQKRIMHAYEDSTSNTKIPDERNDYLIYEILTNDASFDLDKDKIDKGVSSPRLLQISWLIVDIYSNVIKKESYIIKPTNFEINPESILLNGITKEKANAVGEDLAIVLKKFIRDLNSCPLLVCYNYSHNSKVILTEMKKLGLNQNLYQTKKSISLINHFSIDNHVVPLNELYNLHFEKELNFIQNAVFFANASKIIFSKSFLYKELGKRFL
jgi:hypothetical protein